MSCDRMNYFLDTPRKQCNLCLCNSLDTMDHLLQCPALAKEQILLKEEVNAKFKFWGIPYSSFPQKSREEELRNQCGSRLGNTFLLQPSLTLN